MNGKIVAYLLGRLCLACSASLLLPLAAALLYREGDIGAFVTAAAAAATTGLLLTGSGVRPNDSLTIREGLAITTLGWVTVTFLGMIPYAAGGYTGVLDGIVETVSGLSGTGATVIDDEIGRAHV